MDSLRPKVILFATDFLESSRLALDYAVAFANHYRAHLLIMHVFHMPPAAREVELLHLGPSMSRQNREARLQQFAAGVRRVGVNVECRLVEGWMPETLLQKVTEIGPDMLVLGTHGIFRGVGHFVIGSNAEQLLLSAPCPTLTIGRHVPAGISADLSLDHVLYITDFTPQSAAAAPYAVALSRDFQARLDVCHLLPDEGSDDRVQMATRYCEAVYEALPGVEIPWCAMDDPLKHAAEPAKILRRTETETGGVIVLGVKAGSHFAHHLSSSFAYQLVATATSPVFTVRG